MTHNNPENIDHEFASFDYVRHCLTHQLSLDGIRVAFQHAKSIDDLSQALLRLSANQINCEWFDPAKMRTKYLTSINLVRKGLNVSEFAGDDIPKDEMKSALEQDTTMRETRPSDSTKVFVVHGRNGKARDALFQFLRSIGLKPIEWSQAIRATGKGAPYIGEVLDAAFTDAQAVVVLITPDDFAYLRDELRQENEPLHETQPTPQVRPNVLFEAGMAFGRHPDRTLLVELGGLRPFSDVGGRHTIRLNNTTERRQDLAERLQLAGCSVDLTGRDWHSAGDFNAALEGL